MHILYPSGVKEKQMLMSLKQSVGVLQWNSLAQKDKRPYKKARCHLW